MTHPSLTFSPDSLTHLQSSIPLSVSPPLSTPSKLAFQPLTHGSFFTGAASSSPTRAHGIFFTGAASSSPARAHGNFFTGTIKLSLLSLGVCLPSQGGSRSNKISPNLVRSRQIQRDPRQSGEISSDLARSCRIWLDLAVFCHGTTISCNQRKPDRNRLTNPITDPPDPTSLMDGQRVLSLQTRLSRLG